MKYLLEYDGVVTPIPERPTHDELKNKGVGVYSLRHHDGALIRRHHVDINRLSNMSISTELPRELEGVTTNNLGRLIRAYDKVVKYWPAKASDVRKIRVEIEFRNQLIGSNQQSDLVSEVRS